MPGKGSLILIIGFTLIFIVMGYFWGGLATRSVDNHVSYYKNTVAHNIAVTGANLALHEVLKDSSWNAGISNRDFEYGKINVTVKDSLADTVKIINSVGTFMGVDALVKVKLNLSTFAKYAWWIAAVSTGSPNKRTWVTGDTVWGGFHSDQFLNIDGDPVFYGRVSVEKGINMTPGSMPEFLGGYVTGVHVEWDPNMKLTTQAAADAGVDAGGTCRFDDVDLWLTFNSNGTVTYRSAKNAGDDSTKYPPLGTPGTTGILPLTTMAPTGIIYLDKGDVYLSGTLYGKVTVVSDQSSGSGGGNVYFTGDMVYNTPAMLPDGNGGYIKNEDPASTDLMGIIATNNIIISSKNTANNLGGYQNNIVNKDLRIDAGVMCLKGGFQLEDLNPTYMNTLTGTIYLTGSMIAGKEEQVANYNNDVLLGGYGRHIVLDERFLARPPLWFPYSDGYEIISWLE
jgi:hypothetical protein